MATYEPIMEEKWETALRYGLVHYGSVETIKEEFVQTLADAYTSLPEGLKAHQRLISFKTMLDKLGESPTALLLCGLARQLAAPLETLQEEHYTGDVGIEMKKAEVSSVASFATYVVYGMPFPARFEEKYARWAESLGAGDA